MSNAFHFIVPFASERATKDFATASQMLDATLTCCLSQTDMENVFVSVCCHEIPAGFEEKFPAVTFIESPLGPPRAGATLHERRLDKVIKLRRLAVHVREATGGGHVMMTDADDLVGSNLVAHVRSFPEQTSVIFRSGYLINQHAKHILRLPDEVPVPFWEACGTCFVAYLQRDDLPVAVIDFDVYRLFNKLRGHKMWLEDMKNARRPIVESSEFMVAYVRGHGSNLTTTNEDGTFNAHEFARQAQNAKAKGIPVSALADKSFIFPPSFYL